MNIKTDKVWLIWSNEHEAFWCADRNGYSYAIQRAGRYTFDEAFKIVKDANYPSDEHGYPENADKRSKIGAQVIDEVMCPSPELIEWLRRME